MSTWRDGDYAVLDNGHVALRSGREWIVFGPAVYMKANDGYVNSHHPRRMVTVSDIDDLKEDLKRARTALGEVINRLENW